MSNINKLLLIIEELQFELKASENQNERISSNLQIIRKYIKQDLEELQDSRILNPVTESNTYVSYLIYIALGIKRNARFDSLEKNDLLSTNQQNCLSKSIFEIAKYGLRLHLYDSFSNHRVFQNENVKGEQKSSFNAEILQVCLEFFQLILEDKFLTILVKIETVVLDIMAGIFSLYEAEYCECIKLSKEDKQKFANCLNGLWEHTAKDIYFKNLLILKSHMNLSSKLHKILHENLLHKLAQPGGFGILVSVLCGTGAQTKETIPDWKRFDVVAKIVANDKHLQSFNNSIIEQIFKYLNLTLRDNTLRSLAPAGIMTLRRMYDLNQENKNEISSRLLSVFKCLHSPEDILTGAIVMDNHQFLFTINFLFSCICTSSVESLSTEILLNYLQLFLNIYSQLPKESKESCEIRSIIVRCLSNQKNDQLRNTIKNILFEEGQTNLHPRIVVRFNNQLQTFSIQIASEDMTQSYEPAIVLPHVLKNSNNNILVYNVFIELLQTLDELTQQTNTTTSVDLLQDQEELDYFIKTNFEGRLAIISVLTDLIEFKKFHCQFHDNPSRILEFIIKQIKKTIKITNLEPKREEQDQLLSLSLAILQEILETSSDHEKFKDFSKILKNHNHKSRNLAIQHQIQNIIFIIEGSDRPFSSVIDNESQYNFARKMIEEKQSHLRVYGMMQLIKLLNEKNDETIANRHAVLALAMHALQDDESYTYLNCVRLLVALINVLEDEVLETLSSEFLNTNEKIEYRLKVGEAIVKVTEYLGPISYKYKNILINCFMHGCRQPIDEFRCSSFSNLATICKLLTFQVHSFFQELMSMIESSIQTETYIPAKRAAVMVLDQLLQGIENLIDFEELLLPIYRLLNTIISNEKDPVTRVHATNGLASLAEKCKRFLFPEQKIEKKIQIFGINDTQLKRKQNSHILELN